VDVRTLPPDTFGAAMQYFTGSKDHNVAIRTRAVRMGFKLSEYGLFRVEDESKIGGETEDGIYHALGLPWIPPELRENTGEIEAAEAGRLPELVELSQIRGDIHMHTTETDGRATLEEMAAAARDRGLPVHRHHGTTPRRWPMPTGSTKSASWNSPAACAKSTATASASASQRHRVRHSQDGAMDLANDALAELDLRHRQRAQPHEPGIRRDDRPPAARAGVPVATGLGASDGPIALARDASPSISSAS